MFTYLGEVNWSFWWWQCSDKCYYLPLPPALYPLSTILPVPNVVIGLVVFVDVKHHVYLLKLVGSWIFFPSPLPHQGHLRTNYTFTGPPHQVKIQVAKTQVKSLAHSSGIVQELCESRGGRPGLSVLTSLLVCVDVKNY